MACIYISSHPLGQSGQDRQQAVKLKLTAHSKNGKLIHLMVVFVGLNASAFHPKQPAGGIV